MTFAEVVQLAGVAVGGIGSGVFATWQVMRQQISADRKTAAEREIEGDKSAAQLAAELIERLMARIAKLEDDAVAERSRCDEKLAAQDARLSEYRHEMRSQDAKIEALRAKAGIPPARFQQIIAELEVDAGVLEPQS